MNFLKSLMEENIYGNIDIKKILTVVVILILGMFCIRIIRVIVSKSIEKSVNQQTKVLMSRMVDYVGFAILLMIILSELGLKLSTLLGAAGVLGLAVGVASQKSIGNIVSGLFLVTEKSIEIGDVIKVGGNTGNVYSIDLLSIMLKTFDNQLIRIPNETLISTEITNITKFPIRRMDFQILVAYKEDIPHVIDCLKGIARENTLCLDEPDPLVMVKEFADSGIDILFGIWFEKSRYLDTKNTVMIDIQRRFREENIEIPYKHIRIVNAE